MVCVREILESGSLRFGTSGVRGLACDFDETACHALLHGFLHRLASTEPSGQRRVIALGGDRRASTPAIVASLAAAAEKLGFRSINLGVVPTPAIASWAMKRRIPAAMVTGSHIPADRNGIKLFGRAGEIGKDDELAILDAHVDGGARTSPTLPAIERADAGAAYVERYVRAFPEAALVGLRIGVYGHSAAGREHLCRVLEGLGARVELLGCSDTFVAVDTEALDARDIHLAASFARQGRFDAIVSTDGDGDRPLVSDERGVWLRGDVLGLLCARYVGASTVVTPITSSTALEHARLCDEIVRTRVGSPYVVAAMAEAVRAGRRRVVGYEANGGFLTASDLQLEDADACLPALPTRDATIVICAVLREARRHGLRVSELARSIPPRFSKSGRLSGFPTELSARRLARIRAEGIEGARRAFVGDTEAARSFDTTDGLRLVLASGDVVHVRPSGNAPELRCYTEAASDARAAQLLDETLGRLARWRMGELPATADVSMPGH
ncbi:MAG: phosphomannomutase [Polyangiaceae bacterium]|nr:phosphomannomutase [Polyangiaceae bacterium]